MYFFGYPALPVPKLTSLYINDKPIRLVSVVRKRILDIMFPVRTSSLHESILVESLVYFSRLHPRFARPFQTSILSIFGPYIFVLQVYFSLVSCLFFQHPCFVSLFQLILLSIFQAYILASRVYFSRVSCLFFDPTSSLRKNILVESLVYFQSLHPCFASPFQLSLLSIFEPPSSLPEYIQSSLLPILVD